MAEIKDYPMYLNRLNRIENGDFSAFNEIFQLIKTAQNRIKLLSGLVGAMKDRPKCYISYTVGRDCKRNNVLPDFIPQEADENAKTYLRSLCSTTKEGEYFTVNFHGGLISTISCFGYRFKKQFYKLFSYHPITSISIIDSWNNGINFEKIRWYVEECGLSIYDFANFEEKNKIKFRNLNDLEYDEFISDLILHKYRNKMRGEYVKY